MSYDIERLTAEPTSIEVEDIAALSDCLTNSTVDRQLVEDNLTNIAANPFQYLFVARDSGRRIIGMTLMTLKVLPHERTAYEDSMIVHPDHRRQGIGSALRLMITNYADINRITLQGTTSRDREEGWRLHKQSGYREWDTRFIVRKPQ